MYRASAGTGIQKAPMTGEQNTPPDDGWLTVKEAAKRAHCSESTIKRRISEGKLPAIRNGRKYLVRAEDVDNLFAPTLKTEQEVFDYLERQIEALALNLSEEHKLSLAAMLS